MSITRTARPERKLHLSRTTLRLLVGGELGDAVAQSVHCEKPEDQTKNDCTSPQRLESIAVSVVDCGEQSSPKRAPQR